ncbi:hypothetical protein B0H14DRAFT_828825 [Mycena olivaceomarginata]|nr:hypothetical protein B0H14DRAFT_828825 [Mycena olivaceomarginata]
MAERGGTASKSAGRATTGSKRTITDSDYNEPTTLSPKRRKAAQPIIERRAPSNRLHEEGHAEKHRNTLRNGRNREVHEGVATRVEEVAGQVGPRNAFTPSRETLPTRVLAALRTAVGDPVDLVQPIFQGTTQITIFGGTGGNGGNGVGRGIGGGGGVGEGPRLIFSGTQIIILDSEGGGQVNSGIDRIGEGLANIWDGVTEVGGQFRSYVNDLLRRLGSQLTSVMRNVPRGVSDHLFYVIDPIGGYIPVSLRYCHDYAELDELIKKCLHRYPEAGACYVERGDYSIVSEAGSFILPVEFAQTVRAGMMLEISILQRHVQSLIEPGENVESRSDEIHNTTCPHCRCSQVTTTGNGWFKCGNSTCAKNYRIDEPDQDSEELMGPQLAQPNEEAEPNLFRRVHIRIVYGERFAPLGADDEVATEQAQNVQLRPDTVLGQEQPLVNWIPVASQAPAGSNRDVIANRRAIRMANLSAAEMLRAELSGAVPVKPNLSLPAKPATTAPGADTFLSGQEQPQANWILGPSDHDYGIPIGLGEL